MDDNLSICGNLLLKTDSCLGPPTRVAALGGEKRKILFTALSWCLEQLLVYGRWPNYLLTNRHCDVAVVVQLLSHVWLFVTPWIVAHQAPLSMGFPKQKYWSELPFPSPRDLPNPGDQTRVSCIGRRILYCWATREAPGTIMGRTSLTPYWIYFSLTFVFYWFGFEQSLKGCCL